MVPRVSKQRAVLAAFAIFAIVFAGCAGEAPTRARRIVEALSDDNLVFDAREPELVAAKLRKMQRGPYEWLRGTASLCWRDLMEPGGDRPRTTFGDPLSSRVLLVGDPHPENLGTFHAADGTMFVDWNDFDATGYVVNATTSPVELASDHALSDGVDWDDGASPAGMSFGRSPTIFGDFVTGARSKGLANP